MYPCLLPLHPKHPQECPSCILFLTNAWVTSAVHSGVFGSEKASCFLFAAERRFRSYLLKGHPFVKLAKISVEMPIKWSCQGRRTVGERRQRNEKKLKGWEMRLIGVYYCPLSKKWPFDYLLQASFLTRSISSCFVSWPVSIRIFILCLLFF